MISQLRALPSAPSILPFSELAFHHIAQDNNECVSPTFAAVAVAAGAIGVGGGGGGD